MNSESNLLNMVFHYAQTQPQQIALKFLESDYQSSQELSYHQLGEKVLSLAKKLAALQTKQNQTMQKPILLLFDSSINYIVSFLAVLHSGNIAVTAYPPRQVRHLQRLFKIITDSSAQLILTTSAVKNYCDENKFEFPKGTTLVCVDSLAQKPSNLSISLPEVCSEHIAFLQYTSGSTGSPKGVVVTHKNICANLKLLEKYLGHESVRTCVSWLPIFHDMGLIGNTLLPLYTGGTCVFMEPFTFLKHPFFWLQAMSREQGTYTMAPNFSYDLALKALKSQKSPLELDFSYLRCAVNGAEPINPETIRLFEQTLAPYNLKECTMKPGYGMAETTLCISVAMTKERSAQIDKNSLERGIVTQTKNSEPGTFVELVSCGHVPEEYLVRIVDPNTLHVLPVNTVGELWVQGDSVASGYYKNPEKTKEIFEAFTADTHEGPFLRTGDLAFLDEKSRLTICGRVKDLIIINGRNIYPQDIEAACYQSERAIMSHCAAAFSITQDSGEACVLVAEAKAELGDTQYREIIAKIKKAVLEATDVSLSDIVLIPPQKILKTSSGKIQRSACKQAYLNDEFQRLAWMGQYTEKFENQQIVHIDEMEHKLVLWLKEWIATQTSTPLEAIEVNGAFSEYGLTSLQLVTMMSDLEKVVEQALDPWLAWEFPNIHSLCAHLIQHEATNNQGVESKEYEPIAIIGMDCRLPGKNYQDINGLDEFWQSLLKEEDSIEPIPPSHWDNRLYFDAQPDTKGKMYSAKGGFLNDVKRFDTKFFNIAPREAEYLDPQQRLALTTTWHALEDAGLVESELKGSHTGIYLGISTHDYDQLIQKQIPLTELGTYQATGTSFATSAGRIAYFLGTNGPCMAIDTACSSSLVCIHQASRALQAGDCELAIAGGVNLILSPESSIIFCKSGMLSHHDRCSTFDISADGYVRGEGCGIVVLKKLSDALRDGDRIHAVIYGSAVNQDGASNGLTAPNLAAQVDVINTALNLAHLKPEQITHVEAHGTGTELGDPIEWEGIRRTYAQERRNPLYVSSVKTRIGHLEAAAGVAGFIKTVLAIKYGQIPAHLNLHQLNPKLHLHDSMSIPMHCIPWENESRYAGISAFGFSGTNAHIILGNTSRVEDKKEYINRPEHLWVVSAKEPQILQQYLQNYRTYGEQHSIHFPSLAHQSLTQRTHFPYRAFISAQDQSSWLSALQQQQWHEGKIVKSNQLAWLFTGQGCLVPNVATALYQTIPEFAAVLEQCCAIAQNWLSFDLRTMLLNTPSDVDINNTLYAQPTLFVYEYSLAQWFLHLGLKPNVLLGHSLGEYVATCVAGILTLHDALYLVCKRALLISSLPVSGGMLAINAAATEVEQFIYRFDDLVISLKNGPEQTVVSGTDAAILACQNYCDEQGIRCKKVATSHAFHSPLMQPIVDEFAKIAAEITYHPAKIAVVSNVTGALLTEGEITKEYWCAHMLQTVEFLQGIHTLVACGVELCQEIGPKPILVAQAQMVHEFIVLPSVSEPENPWPGLMETLGTFYLRGVDIKWHLLNKHASFVHEELLKYPFGGKEYWLPKNGTNSSPSSEMWKTYLYRQQWVKADPHLPLISLKNEQVLLSGTTVLEPNSLFLCTKMNFLPTDKVMDHSNENVLQKANWIVYFCQSEPEEIIAETISFTHFVQYLIQNHPEKPVLLLTEYNSLIAPSLLALLKSIKQEYPLWSVHYLEFNLNDVDNNPMQFIGSKEENYWALHREEDVFYRQDISPVEVENIGGKRKISADFSCLVTGAGGDVGQALIESLSALGARYIIAIGRKKQEPTWSEEIVQQKNQGTKIKYYSCDIADYDALLQLMEKLPDDFPPIGMVVHAAGVAHDKPWQETTQEDIREILSTKALGAWNLHQATLNYPLKAFIAISSLSAALGNQGQAAYAAANAFLHALSTYRRQKNLPAQSLILGPVKNTGLFKRNEKQLTSYLAEKGIIPLLRAELQMVFQHQINEPNLIVNNFSRDPSLIIVDASSSDDSSNALDKSKVCTAEKILAIAEEVLKLSSGELSITDNWFEFGMDSIMATQLIYKINHRYPNTRISSQDVFNHASAQELVLKLNEHSKNPVQDKSVIQSPAHQTRRTFPLSLQQQEIWNFIQNSPQNLAYQIPMELAITGKLSVDKLQQALSFVLKRHDILRCSFHEIVHQVNQHVHEDCSLTLELYDEYNGQQVADFFDMTFNLSKAPLLKTCLIREGEDQYRWLLVFHHLICDGYTATSFIKEVIAHYEDKPLEDEAIHYSDYVSWQWEQVFNRFDDEIETFWSQQLQGVSIDVPLALETQHPQEAGVIHTNITLKDMNSSLALIEQNKLSLSNYILANLFTMLFDKFEQERQGIIVFFSGRENGDFATVFGDTSNDVLLVGRRDTNIFSLAERLQQQIFSLHEKQYYHIPVFKELGLATPMISFDFQRSSDLNIDTHFQIKALKSGNIQNYLWGDEPRLLSFKVLLKAQSLELSLKYRRDRIDDSLANTLLDAWVNTLRAQEQNNTQMGEKPLALYDATIMQSNLWPLFKGHPDRTPYYVPVFKEVGEVLDIERLNQAINKVIKDTPALQVFFIEDNDRLKWNFNPKANTEVQVINDKILCETIGRLLVDPLDITQAPLFRCYLVHCDDHQQSILLIRFHHLIADGVGAELFFKRLEDVYLGEKNNSESNLHKNSYLHDYHQEMLLYENNKSEYHRYYSEINQKLEPLPDIERPQAVNYVGGVVYKLLPHEDSERVHAFCRRHNISLYTFYFHVFCLTLAEVNKLNKIYISLVKSNRGRLNDPEMIGYYADSVPFLFEVKTDSASTQALKNTQMQVLQLIERFQYPLRSEDAAYAEYTQPRFIFNQYNLEPSRGLLSCADYLIENLINLSGNKVGLWNYNRPEQFNLLVRSSHLNHMMGLVYDQYLSTEAEAELLLKYFREKILSFL
ncbi:type I polyketide synthase [Legionella rowbothamii]|uniref:type I polyketide synthase n=1 Tax=Legionella rowbothamii TaxID=96229 RepID=UPI00105644DB|nr:type I polyketide synthase [Legionella rowbothamii]